MNRYVSTPIEVQAIQWETEKQWTAISDIIDQAPNVSKASWHGQSATIIMSNGGHVSMSLGDWLIRRSNGTVSCLPDMVFRSKYTRVL